MKNQKLSLLKTDFTLLRIPSACAILGGIFIVAAGIGIPSYSNAQEFGNPVNTPTARFCTLSYSDKSVPDAKVACSGTTATTDVVCPAPGTDVELTLTQTDELNFDSVKKIKYSTAVGGKGGVGGTCSPSGTAPPQGTGSCPAAGGRFNVNFANDLISSGGGTYAPANYGKSSIVPFSMTPSTPYGNPNTPFGFGYGLNSSAVNYLKDLADGNRMSAITIRSSFYYGNSGINAAIESSTSEATAGDYRANEWNLGGGFGSWYYGVFTQGTATISFCRPMINVEIDTNYFSSSSTIGAPREYSIVTDSGFRVPFPSTSNIWKNKKVTLPGVVSSFTYVLDPQVVVNGVGSSAANSALNIFSINGTAQ